MAGDAISKCFVLRLKGLKIVGGKVTRKLNHTPIGLRPQHPSAEHTRERNSSTRKNKKLPGAANPA